VRDKRQTPPAKNDSDADPKFDEQGLEPDAEHDYRGRESYEQQRDEGKGGRSGMWDQTDALERHEPTGSRLTQEQTSGIRHPHRPRRSSQL